jgi:putative flippase GtrA
LRIILAEAIARLVSSFVNFSLNRKVVFKSKENYGRTMLRYYILCACQLAASTGLVYLFSTIIFKLSDGSLFDTLIKIVVDTFLFFLSFRIQQTWVFASKKKQ